MFDNICWAILLASVGCAALDGQSNTSIEYNVCRHSEDEVWFYNLTHVECLDECQARPGCISINFHARIHSCYLNMNTSDDKTACKDFIFTEKSATNMALSPECVAAQCHVTQVCVSLDTDFSCKYRECPNPPIVPNGQVLGNQRYVGARVSVVCDSNYVLVGPMSLACESNGVWLDWPAGGMTSPECKRKACVVNPPEAYTVHPERVTFQDAVAICENEGRHLVSFGCEEEYNFVVALSQAHSLGQFYIGLNDLDVTNQWTWLNSPDEVNYTPWFPGEPNVPEQHCIVIRDGLVDCPCSWVVPFICEAD